MPAYAEQIVISTGKSDWTSRIEDDDTGSLVRQLRSYIGPKGKYSNPFYNVALTHSSFESPSAYLFPSFQQVTITDVEKFVQAFVLPERAINDLPQEIRQGHLQATFDARDVEEIVVLICSHGTRDSRCGVLGPILKAEFEEKLERAGIAIGNGAGKARVGLISHIGGHKWAGNVIIYMPSGKLQGGVWYGRVAPEHVEGIIKETILGGRIIEDMFRGGIDRERNILRL